MAALCVASFAGAQDIAPVRPQAPVIVRPYLPVTVPPIRVSNSGRLSQLVRAGMLYLTAQDAIALALENNIDIEVSRYNPFISEWNLERSEAGGALPGVPSGASQAGSVASGQGVAGSQAAAGVSVPGARSSGSGSNATISQIGPVTQNLDPILQESSTFSHISSPQPDEIQSGVFNLVNATHVYSGSYQQGLLLGGIVSVQYSEHYLGENASSDLLNPTVAPSVSVSLQQNLLRGFGTAVNARTITVSRMNLKTTDLNFKTQVISVVTQVLNAYYNLAADYEDLRAKRSASETAQAFVNDVKRQIEIGATAPSDLIAAESQEATSAQAVVDSDVAVRQQEVSLKNLISRTGPADPELANVRIIPIDTLAIPAADELAPVDQMVQQALANRSDLASELAGEKANEVNSLGTKNGILPTLDGFLVESQAGLAGVPKTITLDGFSESGNKYFAGGIGNALGQVFRRNFPTESAGAFYQEPLRNRQAQADYAIDLLSIRQTQLTNRKDLNQVEVDVRNGVVALQQARARWESAVRNRTLQQELFDSEQKRFRLGASTPYNVALQQRDLINAQSAAVAAMVAYTTSRIALDQTLGRTLEANHITMEEAKSGKVSRAPSVP
ncbi:MAG: TolC family protein [Bryobacteraceae bacterium]